MAGRKEIRKTSKKLTEHTMQRRTTLAHGPGRGRRHHAGLGRGSSAQPGAKRGAQNRRDRSGLRPARVVRILRGRCLPAQRQMSARSSQRRQPQPRHVRRWRLVFGQPVHAGVRAGQRHLCGRAYSYIEQRELGGYTNDIKGAILQGTYFRLVQGKGFDAGAAAFQGRAGAQPGAGRQDGRARRSPRSPT